MNSWVKSFSYAKDRPGTLCARAVLLSQSLSLSLALAPGALALVLLLFLQGCVPAASPGTGTAPMGPPIPAIGGPALSRSQLRTGGDLLRAARDSLASGALEWVAATSEEIIREYPALPGSGEAYGLLARASFGLDRLEEGARAAGAYASLLPPNHPDLPDALLLQARALEGTGKGSGAVESLLRLPPESPDSILAAGALLLRALVPDLHPRELGPLTEGLQSFAPYLGIMATNWAVTLYLRGEMEEATRWAESALATSLGPPEEALAEGVLEGRLEDVLGRPLILGVVLPRSGVSPNRLQYSEWVYEGIQVAVEEYRPGLTRPVQLEIVDDRGTPLGGRTAIRSLDGAGAISAIGFLSQDVLREAADARLGGLPLISPFSFLPPEDAPGVYSLSGPDPGGARALARAAQELELASVAIVRPATEEARVEAEAFREEFLALGGRVPPDIVFDSGGTFFQPQFQQVEALLPDGLFLPLTPRDIQLLAPQITFYGVDTLGAQILGTSGWTEEAVVRGVDSRHTDGVVAATTRLTQDDSEAFLNFKAAYEGLLSKTLRSQVPAFGYDAAALILRALESGPRNPGELMEAMEAIQDFPGATGVLSIDGGRITREPLLVRIQDQELIYITHRNQ